AAADAHARLARALVVTNFVQFHVPALAFAVVAQFPGEGRSPVLRNKAAGRRLLGPGFRRGTGSYAASSTVTRCCTLRTWPSTSGVPSTSTLRCSLLSPRPTSVARCVLSRRIGDPVWVILIFGIVNYSVTASA